MIKVGDTIPSARVAFFGAKGMESADIATLCAGKKVALFALPGAFTPKCSGSHLPGYVEHAAALKAKGVDIIACLSVNDAFVMKAWGEQQKVGDTVAMLADGNGEFTVAAGLAMDLRNAGMGQVRTKRCSMLIEDGVVRAFNLEADGDDPTDAETMLGLL